VLALLAGPAAAMAHGGALYTQTNDPAGNPVQWFDRAADGSLTARNADGLTAVLVPSPRDLDFSRDGRYLYAVSPGNATAPAQGTGYRIASGGALRQVTRSPALAGITGAAAG
jgi:hypothetical protein